MTAAGVVSFSVSDSESETRTHGRRQTAPRPGPCWTIMDGTAPLTATDRPRSYMAVARVTLGSPEVKPIDGSVTRCQTKVTDSAEGCGEVSGVWVQSDLD